MFSVRSGHMRATFFHARSSWMPITVAPDHHRAYVPKNAAFRVAQLFCEVIGGFALVRQTDGRIRC
jgi:hypothetical protein